MPGAITGTTDTAVTLNGTNGLVSSALSGTAPSVYSEEVWFKTTTTSGGKIIGFGSSPTGTSGSYDRHVYMINNGQLIFGTWTGQTNIITSPASYNDGTWHQMVATQAGDGMKLYVDGAVVATNPQTGAQNYNGYWRVGGDNHVGAASDEQLLRRQRRRGSRLLDRTVGRSSRRSLCEGQRRGERAADGGVHLIGEQPGCDVRRRRVDGHLTARSRVRVDFGDGSTGTGATPSHTYATANTYTVTLTVTDNSGAHEHGRRTRSRCRRRMCCRRPRSRRRRATALRRSTRSGSTDTDGTIVSYAWKFGDNATGTGVNPSHTYAAANTYLVTLTVTDDQGGTGTMQQSVTVSNAPPTAAFTSSAAGLVCKLQWRRLDRQRRLDRVVRVGRSVTARPAPARHRRTRTRPATTYSVTLTVTDNQGATGTVDEPGHRFTGCGHAVRDRLVRPHGHAAAGAPLTAAARGPSPAERRNFSVGGGVGTIKLATAGSSPSAALAGVSSSDTEVRVGVALNEAQTGGGTYVSVVGRRISHDDRLPGQAEVRLDWRGHRGSRASHEQRRDRAEVGRRCLV